MVHLFTSKGRVEEGKGVGREAEGRVVEEKRGEGCPQLGSLDPSVNEGREGEKSKGGELRLGRLGTSFSFFHVTSYVINLRDLKNSTR